MPDKCFPKGEDNEKKSCHPYIDTGVPGGSDGGGGLPLESRAAAATSKPTETPAVTPGSLPEISPAPEETEPLAGIGGILERLAQDYDPASGAVGAYRWAESVLGQYLADGRDTASARAAGAAYAARYGENDAGR